MKISKILRLASILFLLTACECQNCYNGEEFILKIYPATFNYVGSYSELSKSDSFLLLKLKNDSSFLDTSKYSIQVEAQTEYIQVKIGKLMRIDSLFCSSPKLNFTRVYTKLNFRSEQGLVSEDCDCTNRKKVTAVQNGKSIDIVNGIEIKK